MRFYDDNDQYSKRSPRKCMFDAMMKVDRLAQHTPEVLTPQQWADAREFIKKCMSNVAIHNEKVRGVEEDLVETIYDELVVNMKFHYHLKLDKVVAQ